jgi:hypothetical protein
MPKSRGRPATGQPSRTREAMRDAQHKHRVLASYSTDELEQFSRLMGEISPTMPSRRVTSLYNKRAVSSSTRRYPTEQVEIQALLQAIPKPLIGTGVDICCGNKNIAMAFERHNPELVIKNWDVDTNMQPDHQADYTNPATYVGQARPDFIITRCA